LEGFSESPPTLTIKCPNWAINSIAFIGCTWIVFNLLMLAVDRLEGDINPRWKHPLTHTNPLEK
jgi:hypothetical protein